MPCQRSSGAHATDAQMQQCAHTHVLAVVMSVLYSADFDLGIFAGGHCLAFCNQERQAGNGGAAVVKWR